MLPNYAMQTEYSQQMMISESGAHTTALFETEYLQRPWNKKRIVQTGVLDSKQDSKEHPSHDCDSYTVHQVVKDILRLRDA